MHNTYILKYISFTKVYSKKNIKITTKIEKYCRETKTQYLFCFNNSWIILRSKNNQKYNPQNHTPLFYKAQRKPPEYALGVRPLKN